MTVLPLIPVVDLEYAVSFAWAAEVGHARRCPGCLYDDPHPACVDGMGLRSATIQAQRRLDAAKSQQPDRHIPVGCALQRRLEREVAAAA